MKTKAIHIDKEDYFSYGRRTYEFAGNNTILNQLISYFEIYLKIK